MILSKLEPILTFAFAHGCDPFPVVIDFGSCVESAMLSKQEIANLSNWEECLSIRIQDINGKDSQGNLIERRWRQR